ncbi:hypothetical protein ACHHYP_04504 [Achlya hypogyna]|uniref:Seipin n=1 Tax=Achlya hypogyna TaxID=1202772 RepID=A0A1V9Z0S6_ACHHY|nr:hypothetical protein ACHHYP_04504 [Achlya hypogyna]
MGSTSPNCLNLSCQRRMRCCLFISIQKSSLRFCPKLHFSTMLRPVRFLWSLVVASWPVFVAHVQESLQRLRRYEFAEIISDLSSFSFRWLVRCVQLTVFAILLLSSASAIYGGFYYLIMPAKVLHRPLYFDYGVHSDFAAIAAPASYHGAAHVQLPTALLELTTGEHGRDQWTYGADVDTSETRSLPLTHLTKYDIVLDFEFAQTNVNEGIGMFMVRTQALGEASRPLATSARPTFVRTSHWVVELASQLVWIWPTLVFGYDASLTQRRTLTVVNGFEERRVRAMAALQIELSHPNVQVVSASVSILAQLSGLRYLMYHWFLSTAVVAILNIALVQVFWCFVLYLYLTFPTLPDVIPADDDQEAVPKDDDDSAASSAEEDVPQIYESELILPPTPEPSVRQRRPSPAHIPA